MSLVRSWYICLKQTVILGIWYGYTCTMVEATTSLVGMNSGGKGSSSFTSEDANVSRYQWHILDQLAHTTCRLHRTPDGVPATCFTFQPTVRLSVHRPSLNSSFLNQSSSVNSVQVVTHIYMPKVPIGNGKHSLLLPKSQLTLWQR